MKFQALKNHIEGQVKNILCTAIKVDDVLESAVGQCRHAFSFSVNKYFQKEEDYPSPFHSGKYMILLYYLSRQLFLKDGDGERAEKIYYLNKILNGIDIFYEVALPAVWGGEHPLGSVMGRAVYGDRFFFFQGCTVGGSASGDGYCYPDIGSGVLMYSNSKVLGKCSIGDNVIFSANSYVINQNVPANSIVFGQGKDVVIKKMDMEKYISLTKQIWVADL